MNKENPINTEQGGGGGEGTKNSMEIFSFSKKRKILTHVIKTQFKSKYVDEAHTRWRQEFKGATFLLSKALGLFDKVFQDRK